MRKVILAGLLLVVSIAAFAGFSSGGYRGGSSFSSRSYSSSSFSSRSYSSRSYSSPSYSRASTPVASSTSKYSSSSYSYKAPVTSRPVTPSTPLRSPYSQPYGGASVVHHYYDSGPSFGNFWFWMWALDRHNQPTYVNSGGASGSYAPAQASGIDQFMVVALNVLIFSILLVGLIWLCVFLWRHRSWYQW